VCSRTSPGLDAYAAIEFLRVFGSARYRLRFNPTQPQLVGTAAIPGGGVVAGAATFIVTDSVGTQYTSARSPSPPRRTRPRWWPGGHQRGARRSRCARAHGWRRPVGAAGGQRAHRRRAGHRADARSSSSPPAHRLASGSASALVPQHGHVVRHPDLEGLFVASFPRDPNAPTKVQVSGVASLDITAAGRVTA
jgi:hypothetical protein